MTVGRIIAIFGPLSAVARCASLVIQHPGGYHVAVFDPSWDIALRVLSAGLYVGAGFAAARRRPYAGVPVGATVAGIGFVLGSALSYVAVPGSLGLLLDTTFWGMSLRFGGALEVAFGVAGGAIGTVLSLVPILVARAGGTR